MKNLISKETRDLIFNFCIWCDIENYTINSDGSVDVDGDVCIESYERDTLPFKFNVINGDFRVAHSDISDISMFPNKVTGGFYCNVNMITSCVGITQDVGTDFFICGNEELHSVKGVPMRINGSFSCSDMNIKTLDGMPEYVGEDCDFSDSMLPNLDGIPKKIGGSLILASAVLESLYSSHPISMGGYAGGFIDLPRYSEEVQLLFHGDNEVDGYDEHTPIVYFQYQPYYDVFIDGTFNEENFWILISEIKDGLE
jgi:hypothetical protein